jgi:hypothetical protein
MIKISKKEAAIGVMNKLLLVAKQEKVQEYKDGYVDAILDFYNELIKPQVLVTNAK